MRGQPPPQPKEQSADRGENFWLWTGILLGPVAWFLHFQASYSLVVWVCKHGHENVLHVTSLVCFLLSVAGVALAWGQFQVVPAVSQETVEGRRRFMAVVGMMSSALFALIIVAQSIPSFILSPCQF